VKVVALMEVGAAGLDSAGTEGHSVAIDRRDARVDGV